MGHDDDDMAAVIEVLRQHGEQHGEPGSSQ
jgi:hypothetical protein